MFHTSFVITFSLILSFPLILIIAPHILPPKKQNQLILQISLADELEDLSLFRRATLSSPPSSSSSSSSNKPKIAFLFLTSSHLSFTPLWEKFFSTTNSPDLYNIYVHLDPASSATLTGIFAGRSIAASRRTERSSPTLISAERRLLATALLHDPLNAYFALLSETCIPLHSFPFVYTTLFGVGTRSDLVLGGFFSYYYWRDRKRMSFIEILDDPPPFLEERYDARGEGVMEPEVPFNKFRMGSQFYVLTREHARVVIRDRRLWRKFRLPCLTLDNCYPEEHYFPTLLSMEDPSGCARFSLTRVNWTDSVDGHPHTYRADEISGEMILRLREGNETTMVIGGGRKYEYMFARKFDRSCLKPLMEIADDVIFQD